MEPLAVLGIGRMGTAMARRLSKSGFEVVLWNRTPGAAESLAEEVGDSRHLRSQVPTRRRLRTMLTARQALEMATINGAHVVGLEDKTGSLTPGKKADVVVIDGGAINTAPVIDPVATVVLAADVSNVDLVIINGVVHKREGKMVADVSRATGLVQDARDYLLGAIETTKPEWV